MSDDLVQTPNGTFVTREDAEAAGLEVSKRTAAPRSAPTTTRKTTTRKAAGAAKTGRGK